MLGIVTGFTTILAVVGSGFVLGSLGYLDDRAQRALVAVAYRVATPALMLVTISDIGLALAGTSMVTVAVCLLVSATTYAFLATLVWNHSVSSVIVGSLAASYANAGNLGIAIAAYVIGDVSVVVPTLFVQMLVVQPLAMAALDRTTGRSGRGVMTVLRRLVTMPLTVSAILGFGLAVTGWHLPTLVDRPVRLVAGASIPLMLVAYGAALRSSPMPGRSGHNREIALIVCNKLVLMPIVAYLVGGALGAEGNMLRGIVVAAAFPTAQNVFLHATTYRTGQAVARESIFLTTMLCLPVILVLALLLH